MSHPTHAETIEYELQQWYDSHATLSAAVPLERVTTGDNQDEDTPTPYIVLEVEEETEFNTNSGRGERADVMWHVYASDQQDAAVIARLIKAALDRQTWTSGVYYDIRHSRFVSLDYEQEESGIWRSTAVFDISYGAV